MLKYELTGKNLPELYKDNQDPTFHVDESWELAKGDKWVARIEACGEISINDKDGNWVSVEDVIEKYDTDDKLHEAVDKGEIVYQLNNWYEVEFFADVNGGREYLDIVSDDCVVFGFKEAIEVFEAYANDKEFEADLAKAIEETEEDTMLTFEVEKEYMKGETFRYPVYSDGVKAGDSYDVCNDELGNKIVLGFVVNVYRGMEHIDTQFYPVKTNLEVAPDYDDTGEVVYKNNEAEVLAEIANHYPPEEYQNHNW